MASENYFGAISLEFGIPGLLMIVWIFLRILYHGWTICRSLERNELRIYGYGALAVLIAVLVSGFSGQMLYTSPANFLFWFIGGILCSLGAVERASIKREAEAAQPAPEPIPIWPPGRAAPSVS